MSDGYYLCEDEVTPSGAIIHWSDEDRMSPDKRRFVRITYPCCGKDYQRSIRKLARFREDRPAICGTCRYAPGLPVDPAQRPTCPRCGKRPVAGRYRNGVLVDWTSCCWSCSIGYVDRPTMMAQRAQRKAAGVRPTSPDSLSRVADGDGAGEMGPAEEEEER